MAEHFRWIKIKSNQKPFILFKTSYWLPLIFERQTMYKRICVQCFISNGWMHGFGVLIWKRMPATDRHTMFFSFVFIAFNEHYSNILLLWTFHPKIILSREFHPKRMIWIFNYTTQKHSKDEKRKNEKIRLAYDMHSAHRSVHIILQIICLHYICIMRNFIIQFNVIRFHLLMS